MQANYLLLDCARTGDHSQVSIETVCREALEPISGAEHCEEVRQALAKQLLWQDFAHRGDWLSPAPSAAISAKAGWEVAIFQTVLADDVYMLARKAPKSEESCLPANHFGTSLLHDNDKHGPSMQSVSGRVLLVKVEHAQSSLAGLHSILCIRAYTAKDFIADLQRISDSIEDFLADVSLQFSCDTAADSIPDALPLSLPQPEIPQVSYVRMTCSKNAGGELSVTIEPYSRSAAINFDVPCSYQSVREQLSRGMLWQDFGHHSDWKNLSSKSLICDKSGWQVGILETSLGPGICMLARKPVSGEDKYIPSNQFALRLMHSKHGGFIRFINGSVVFARVDKADQQSLADPRWIKTKGSCKLGSLSIAEFCEAYTKLGSSLRAGISLTTLCEPSEQTFSGGGSTQSCNTAQTEEAAGTKNAASCNARQQELVEIAGSEAVEEFRGTGSSDVAEAIVTPMISSPTDNAELDGWEIVEEAVSL